MPNVASRAKKALPQSGNSMPESQFDFDVFLSHSAKDKDIVRGAEI
jgi:hypothetical protein